MWHITNCFIETDGNPPADYYISSPNGEYLSVCGEKIVASPTIDDVSNFLMMIHHNKTINGWRLKISDSIWIGPFTGTSHILTIPLGNLTISFNEADPVPTLTWRGEPNEDFNLLNRYFGRYTNLKAFW